MGINLNHQIESITTGSTILKQGDVGGFVVANGDGITQKPAASGNNGLIRYNTTTNRLETIVGNSYSNITISSDLTSYLPLAGGTLTGVIGLISGSAGIPSISFSADATTGLFQPTVGYLGFSSSGTERMRIDSSGNISIGTISNTGYRLKVVQAGSTQAYFGSTGGNNSTVVIDNAAGGNSSSLYFANAGTLKWQINNGSSQNFSIQDSVANVIFISATPVSSTGTLTLGAAQNVTINSSGQLSIIQAGSTQAYFSSTGSNSTKISIDNALGGQECDLTYFDAGVQKWSILKTTTNTFNIYDRVAGKSFFSATSGGNLTLGPASNFTIDQSGNAATLTQTFGDSSTKVATTAFVQAALQAIYPIGSLYFNSSNASNPSSIFGFGTWVAFGAGQVPIGVGTFTDTDSTSKTIVAGTTYGEFNHTLTVSEMPSHNHSISDPSHTHSYAMQQSGSDGGSITAASNGRNSSGFTDAATTGITINNNGGGTAHNNMQPSIGVYIWQRTA